MGTSALLTAIRQQCDIQARMTKITEEMLADIDKNTVDFTLNFDDSLKEPTVLPSKIPNLLVNGVSGIAVGMATNMAPHNLSEVIDACLEYIKNRDITVKSFVNMLKDPISRVVVLFTVIVELKNL